METLETTAEALINYSFGKGMDVCIVNQGQACNSKCCTESLTLYLTHTFISMGWLSIPWYNADAILHSNNMCIDDWFMCLVYLLAGAFNPFWIPNKLQITKGNTDLIFVCVSLSFNR